LGPAGMGIQGLLQSATQLIQSFTSFGLSQSAVRDISEANATGDNLKIGKTISIVRRLVWGTGLLGLVVTLVLSPLLSKYSFGNYDYTIPFVLLSMTLLLDQLCVGQKVLLQGLRRLSYLAKASSIGATLGLLVSIPIYYLFGIRGIVPTLILTSLTSLLLTWYYSRKVKIEKIKINNKQALTDGRDMLKMGLALSISSILALLCAYLLRSFIRYQDGVEQVGFFTAGWAIMNTYVGMVFTAMGTDYYPRLAAVNKDNEKCKQIINQQGEIAIIIIAPLVLACVIFMPFIVRLLYSSAFDPASDYILWAIVGMIFKAASWVVSYVFLAKSESRLFIVNETIGNIYTLSFNLLGYYLAGLEGLGISFVFSYMVYLLQVYLISKYRYNFAFSRVFLKIFYAQLLLVFIGVILVHVLDTYWVFVPLSILLIISTIYSYKELDNRINISQLLKTILVKR
jgi:PST family polysaccharide transporter